MERAFSRYNRCASVPLVRSMRAPRSLLDVTNTVSIGNEQAVADAIRIAFWRNVSGAGSLIETCFTPASPQWPSIRGQATPVTRPATCRITICDIRFDAALVMARLIAGHLSEQARVSPNALSPEHGLLGVLLGLLHDSGFIRKTSEAALCVPTVDAGARITQR